MKQRKCTQVAVFIAIAVSASLGFTGFAMAQSPENRPLSSQPKSLTMPVMPTMPQKPVMAPPPVMAKPGTSNLTQQKMQPNAAGASGQQKYPTIETEQQPPQKKPEVKSVKEPSSTASPPKHPKMESEKEPAQKKPEMESVKEPSDEPKHPTMESEKEPPQKKPIMESVKEPRGSPASRPFALTIRRWQNPPVLSREQAMQALAALPSSQTQQNNEKQIANAITAFVVQSTGEACTNACGQSTLQCLANVANSAAQYFNAPDTAPDPNSPYTNNGPSNPYVCNSSATMVSPFGYVLQQEDQCANTAISCYAQCGASANVPDNIKQIVSDFSWQDEYWNDIMSGKPE